MVSKESFPARGNILETSYGLVENDNISPRWRNMHCILLIISAVSGLVYYCSFAALNDQLNRTCIVDIILVFKQSNPDVIDDAASNWGDPSDCDFCLYATLVSSILALIFLVYFIMSGKGGRGTAGSLAQPWRIVIATILFSSIGFSLCLASTWLTYFGRSNFCDQLKNRNLTVSQSATEDHSTAGGHMKLINVAGCKDVYVDNKPAPSYGGYVSAAEISGILNTVAWLTGFLLALIRFLIMPDFRLLRFDFILVPSRKDSKPSVRNSRSSASSASSNRDADKISLPGSAHSSASMLSTAQTALTSLDQQSLKQRESSEDDELYQ